MGSTASGVNVLCLDRSLPLLSAPGSRMEVTLPQQRLPQQRDHPNPPQAREGLILQNTECLRSAEQPQLPLSSSSAQPSTLLSSFQPRKLLSSAGTSPAKPAASRRRLSPGWRRLFWSVCRSFYLHSELCTALVWDGKPGSCLPDGCRVSLGEAVGVRAHWPRAAAGTGIAPAALSLLVWCQGVNAQCWDRRTALPKCGMWGAGLAQGPSPESYISLGKSNTSPQ